MEPDSEDLSALDYSPKFPWEKVRFIQFAHHNRYYLLIYDYFTGDFEIILVPKGSRKNICEISLNAFARHEIPEVLIAERSSGLESRQFWEFVHRWKVRFCLIEPRSHTEDLQVKDLRSKAIRILDSHSTQQPKEFVRLEPAYLRYGQKIERNPQARYYYEQPNYKPAEFIRQSPAYIADPAELRRVPSDSNLRKSYITLNDRDLQRRGAKVNRLQDPIEPSNIQQVFTSSESVESKIGEEVVKHKPRVKNRKSPPDFDTGVRVITV